MDLPKLPFKDYLSAMGAATGDIDGLAVESDATVKAPAEKSTEATSKYLQSLNTSQSKINDGDWNFWNRGITTKSTAGMFSDTWGLLSGNSTVNRIASLTSSKDYACEIVASGVADAIYQRLPGKRFWYVICDLMPCKKF